MKIHTKTLVTDVQSGDDGVTFSYGDETGKVDYLVIAAGRGPDVEALGLDAAGVKLGERGLIEVDGAPAHLRRRHLRDRRPRARPRARAQGLRRGRHRRRGRRRASSTHPHRVPRHPARHVLHAQRRLLRADRGAGARGRATTSWSARSSTAPSAPAPSTATAPGLIKVVGETKYGELLGGHIVGAKATELIQELVNARALEGGYSEVARIVHGHPTLSEGVMEAARAADGWLIHG